MHFFSLDVLYAPRLPDLYFWWKSCVLYSRFYGNLFITYFRCSMGFSCVTVQLRRWKDCHIIVIYLPKR